MIEKGAAVQENFKKQDSHGRRTKKKNTKELYQSRKEYFKWVKSNARAGVYIEIRMMHTMDFPEWADFVKEDMLPIDKHVQDEDGTNEFNPGWEFQPIKHAPFVFETVQGHSSGNHWRECANKDSRYERNGNVGEPASPS